MNTSNFPSTTPAEYTETTTERREPRNIIIVVLAISILGTWGYVLWAKNKEDQKMTELVNQHDASYAAKMELQTGYDASLTRLDSLAGYNNKIEGNLSEANSEIARLKSQINGILRKDNITQAELRKAEELIAELNDRIRFLEKEIVRLKLENQALATETAAVILERDTFKAQKDTLEAVTKSLADKVYIGSTLNAYSITIKPVNKKSGNKEKVTTKAKKADKFVLAFDVDNRIVETGSTEIYILIVGPDGKPVNVESLASGTFTSLEEGEKPYTAIIPVEVESGKKKHVEFSWNKNQNFKKGKYHFSIYHNGVKIGESTSKLS